MNHNPRSWAIAAITMLMSWAGCQTGKELPAKDGAANATSTPEEQKVQSAIGDVLDAHGFVPTVFTPGPDSGNYAISGRPRSQAELVLALVKMTADRQVTVELTPYARMGSSWPSLGRLFRGPIDQEARAMEKEIEQKLHAGEHVAP
jgi:hypothetical protein